MGTTKSDNTRSVSDSIDISDRNFSPEYDLGKSLPDTTKADLTRGYSDNGKSVGE